MHLDSTDWLVDDPDGLTLADWLAAAREQAEVARGSEDRTRHALYAAIGLAHDFAIAATQAPAEFALLASDAGLTVQARAPLTPVVKLVFGAHYDKTRLTEYAAAMAHALRIGLKRGELAAYLAAAPGGLKGVVHSERLHRRQHAGQPAPHRRPARIALDRKLRDLPCQPFAALPANGAEFAVVIARRLPSGEVALLGEVADDAGLLERAARKLIDGAPFPR